MYRNNSNNNNNNNDDDDDDDDDDDNDDNNKWYTHMPKPVCEKGDVTVVWNQAVNTDREVTANRLDIIIKTQKRKHAH